jgi:hypothetical protein
VDLVSRDLQVSNPCLLVGLNESTTSGEIGVFKKIRPYKIWTIDRHHSSKLLKLKVGSPEDPELNGLSSCNVLILLVTPEPVAAGQDVSRPAVRNKPAVN